MFILISIVSIFFVSVSLIASNKHFFHSGSSLSYRDTVIVVVVVVVIVYGDKIIRCRVNES